MIDICDRDGNVVAIILDNGTVVRKDNITDEQKKEVKEKVSDALKERK